LIINALPLAGAYEIKPEFTVDERGSFGRIFCKEEFEAKGLETSFVQHSVSTNKVAGTLRGLHFQQPYDEIKLITCTTGEAFDVIVDIRPKSQTYGQWHSINISNKEKNMVYVPKGFAHGFQSLQNNTVINYQISAPHRPEASKGICWNDPSVNIDWPLNTKIISERDQTLPNLINLS
jgi:dTDP-4-dehydrorhamnose 3,5-epimerase